MASDSVSVTLEVNWRRFRLALLHARMSIHNTFLGHHHKVQP